MTIRKSYAFPLLFLMQAGTSAYALELPNLATGAAPHELSMDELLAKCDELERHDQIAKFNADITCEVENFMWVEGHPQKFAIDYEPSFMEFEIGIKGKFSSAWTPLREARLQYGALAPAMEKWRVRAMKTKKVYSCDDMRVVAKSTNFCESLFAESQCISSARMKEQITAAQGQRQEGYQDYECTGARVQEVKAGASGISVSELSPVVATPTPTPTAVEPTSPSTPTHMPTPTPIPTPMIAEPAPAEHGVPSPTEATGPTAVVTPTPTPMVVEPTPPSTPKPKPMPTPTPTMPAVSPSDVTPAPSSPRSVVPANPVALVAAMSAPKSMVSCKSYGNPGPNIVLRDIGVREGARMSAAVQVVTLGELAGLQLVSGALPQASDVLWRLNGKRTEKATDVCRSLSELKTRGRTSAKPMTVKMSFYDIEELRNPQKVLSADNIARYHMTAKY